MKKAAIAVVVVLILAAGGVAWYFLHNLDSIARAAIERYGTRAYRTAVHVQRVHIGLKNGAGAVYGLTIANPKGFKTRTAFSLKEISFKLDLSSLGRDVLILDDVTVRNPRLNYEMNKKHKISLDQLNRNMSGAKAGGKEKKKKKKKKKKKQAAEGEGKRAKSHGPKMIVRKFTFEGGVIAVRIIPLDKKRTYKFKLQPFEMTDLGAPDGATSNEINRQIMARINKEAQDALRSAIFGGHRAAAEGKAKKKSRKERRKERREQRRLLKQMQEEQGAAN